MSDPVASVWHLYGLTEDPFFQTELKAVSDASYPPTLFVGREEELRLLHRQIAGSPSSRVLVQGHAGVGKTSFVNRLKADLAVGGVLSHEKPVHQTSASQLVNRLTRRGVLVPTRTEVRNTYYRATGNTGIALGLSSR